MADFTLFLIGSYVTLLVGAAVALLMWGAAREPGPGEPDERPENADPTPASRN